MKKIALLAFLLLTFSTSQAQTSVGNLTFDLGTGIGLYFGSTNDPNETDSSGLDAGAFLYNFTAGYCFMDELVAEAQFELNNFIIEEDSATDEYGRSINIRINGVYMLVNNGANTLAFGAGAGFSSFKYGDNSDNSEVTGGGFTYDFTTKYQHYFGDVAGFFLQGSWTGYSYGKLTDEEGEVWTINNSNTNIKLNLNGVNLRAGLALRF